MPTIIDNIETRLLDELQKYIGNAKEARFCVGYLNLRGWEALGQLVENLSPNKDNPPCKVLVGMVGADIPLEPDSDDSAPIVDRRYTKMQVETLLKEFQRQITWGIPTETAQRSMQRLARQIRKGLVQIKLFVKYPLHAKLYLLKRNDAIAPLIGYVGSSNLTLAGITFQGELNVDVVDQDASRKLLNWFDDRWKEAIDISELLLNTIDKSWAGESIQQIPNLPYLIYLKVAYHLSEDMHAGQQEFKLPAVLRDVLMDYQVSAVQLAGRILYRQGGVLLGDVVGLGKTLMATALARMFQELDDSNTLVICPPNWCLCGSITSRNINCRVGFSRSEWWRRNCLL